MYNRSQNPNDRNDNSLLESSEANTIIIDFSGTPDLKKGRNLACKFDLQSILNHFYIYCRFLDNIITRAPNVLLKNDHIDMSFISYKHPST